MNSTLTNERLDLLAVADDGQLVVIELKRDDSGDDVHWQAIKYTSYFHNVDKNEIVDMAARYWGTETNVARQKLMEHTNSDADLEGLNESQRIVLASHRFAPAVTSAAVWLNNQAKRDLITCVQLTPYRNPASEELFLLANTIIPVAGVEQYFVGLRGRSEEIRSDQNRFGFRQDDEVTQFCRRIGSMVSEQLSSEVRPTRTSRWAGLNNRNRRYYHMWYRDEKPWDNWDTSYRILLDSETNEAGVNLWNVEVGLACGSIPGGLEERLMSMNIFSDIEANEGWIFVRRNSSSLDASFCTQLTETVCKLVIEVTPVVRDLANEQEI